MTVYVDDPDFTLHHGDVLDVLPTLPDQSVNCVITSPPYWGLRDYGTEGQLGLEETPDEYVGRMVDVFRQIRRVLRDDGTLWLNIGDSYAANVGGKPDGADTKGGVAGHVPNAWGGGSQSPVKRPDWLKPKDLVGVPWRVAFALQADGWYLRSDIIWAKPNAMPESVTDRPTKAHEYVFLLSKSPRYYWDQEAVKEAANWERWGGQTPRKTGDDMARGAAFIKSRSRQELLEMAGKRNVRSVWEIATQPYAEAHFATYPQELVRRCLLAGCPEWVCATCGEPRMRLTSIDYDNPGNRSSNGARKPEDHRASGVRTMAGGKRLEKRVTTEGFTDCGHDNYRPGTVLDPFMGSGTTALVARNHDRHSIGIELNADYCQLAAKRLAQQSLLAGDAAA